LKKRDARIGHREDPELKVEEECMSTHVPQSGGRLNHNIYE
jgi:hypothetical protein